MFKRQFLAFLLILSLVAPLFYLPYQAKKAQAFLGFGDLVIDIKALAERIIDGIAMTAAQLVVDRMVSATVDWARNGFEGGPAYVKDPRQYFTDIADGVIGQAIYSDEDIGFLCSPFRDSVKVSLINHYYKPDPFQCTLSDVGDNIENFYKDFTQGGWDTWFEMTQNPVNNPYGAYLEAQFEITNRLAKATNIEEKQLDRNQGFMSWSRCVETNPPAWIDSPSSGGTLGSQQPNPKHVPGKAVGECIQRGPVETPGTTIKNQLDRVLPSGLEKLISVEHVEQLINAVAAGLLQKYVFGPKGLFARDNTPETGGGTTDIDGDGTPDGLDSNGDGTLDICYFGGADGNPNSKPCLGSSRAGQTGQSPPGEAQCPIPDTPRSLCENVDGNEVLNILDDFPATNEGITQAIEEVKKIYPDAYVIPHDTGTRVLDKIDFGGGLIVDAIRCAGGTMAANQCEPSWTFDVECQCGGPPETSPSNPTP